MNTAVNVNVVHESEAQRQHARLLPLLERPWAVSGLQGQHNAACRTAQIVFKAHAQLVLQGV